MHKINLTFNIILDNLLNLTFLTGFTIGINSLPEPTSLVKFIAFYLIIRLTLNITSQIRITIYNAKQDEKR